MDNWIHIKEVNFSDTNILQYHIDTRDFHVAVMNTVSNKLPDLSKL